MSQFITPSRQSDKEIVIKVLLSAHREAKFAAQAWQEGVDMAAQNGYSNDILKDHVEMRKMYDREAAAIWKAKSIIEKYL